MRYTDEHKEFVRNHKTLSTKELTYLFNSYFGVEQTETAIRGLRERSGARKYKHHIFTEEQVDFIRQNKDMSYKELTIVFNQKFGTEVNYTTISRLVHNNNWKNKQKKHKHSDEEIEFLIKHKDLPRNVLALVYNKKFNQNDSIMSIEKVLQREGGTVKKYVWTDEHMKFIEDNFPNMKNDEFQKMFNEKFNVNFSSTTLRRYANEILCIKKTTTQTKTCYPQYTVLTRKHGKDRERKLIKVSDKGQRAKYMYLERYIYEKQHNIDTCGQFIIHLNGDVEDFTPENLYCFNTISEFARYRAIFDGTLNEKGRNKEVYETALYLVKLHEKMPKGE